MSDLTSRDLARHAKLFELLRQQNAARETHKRVQGNTKQPMSDAQRFKQMAERSLAEPEPKH